MATQYQIKSFKGKEILPFIDELGSLRVKIFREFPYLYDGDLETERRYMSGFANSNKSVLIAVFLQEQMVGFIIGTALDSGLPITADAHDLFSSKNLPVNNYYYIGDLVLLEEHRSFGLATKLLKLIETFAADNGYCSTCFLTVFREPDHPLKPKGYKDTARLWEFRKTKKMNLSISYPWRTFISESESVMLQNTLDFWEKDIIGHRDKL